MSGSRDFADVVEHEPVCLTQFGSRVVPPQRGGKFRVEAGSAKELQVAFQSVEALVLHRNDRRDHLLLPSSQGESCLK